LANPTLVSNIPDLTDEDLGVSDYDLSVYFSDADAAETLTYSVSGLHEDTGFSIDPATGILSGTPSGADLAQNTTVTVRATDGNGDFAEYSFTLAGTNPPIGGGGKNWGPSYGVKTQGDHANNDSGEQATYQADRIADFQSGGDLFDANTAFVAEGHTCEWAIIKVAWGVINPTGTTYDYDFINDLLVAADANGFRVALQIAWDSSEGDNPQVEGDPTVQLVCPADLRSSYTSQTGSSATTHMWETVVRLRS